MAQERRRLYRYWQPAHWPLWLGLGCLRLICLLPNRRALAVGRAFGRLAHALGGKRRLIVRRNLKLCFPELSVPERRALARRHFEALGMSLIEMGWARWASDDRLLAVTTLKGIEHVTRAADAGQGVILLSAHFTTLEVSGRVLALKSPPFDFVYRRHRSDFMTEILCSGREVAAADAIEKSDIGKMVRRLRRGRTVWYAPDQSYDGKGAEVVEFFGVPTMHTTATSTIARLGRAVALPYFPRRLADGRYEIDILPPLDDFPGDDPLADTRQYVRLLEAQIRRCPEQYLWVHRKFKNLPETYADYYADLGAAE